MKIGTAKSEPGKTTTGWLELTELPTGGVERIPVCITEGEKDGPTLWVTGAIHGDEVTGIGVAQDFMTDDIAENLRGNVVCIPILNPSGVRTEMRNSYYHDEDPNRNFPYGSGEQNCPQTVQVLINERIFEEFARTADALVSLHQGWVNESMYTIVERVRYGEERSRDEAEQLADETLELAEALGLPIIHEYEVGVQEEYGLQSSFECAAVNAASVPAVTAELGSPHVIEDKHLEAAIEGIRNIMCVLSMLPGEPCETEAPKSPVDYPVKRVDGPVTDVPGIVRHRVDVGDVVVTGDKIADITTPHGKVKTTIETRKDGYILGRRQGIATYENDILVSMAARDDSELVTEST